MGSLLVERRDAIALLTLSNPAKRNALDVPMLESLAETLPALARDGIRAAVLTGEGARAFSAGYDLSALPDPGLADHDDNPLARALDALSDADLPVVAALNGVAIGGGCALAVGCDLRVAHAGVSLCMPPVRLGLIYPPRGLERFLSLIGTGHTRELFLTAAPVPAELALAWGLVDRLVAEADVLPSALALAAEIARGAPLALRGTRRAIELLSRGERADNAELAALVRAAWSSEDAREAQAAFAEKRSPKFTGR